MKLFDLLVFERDLFDNAIMNFFRLNEDKEKFLEDYKKLKMGEYWNLNITHAPDGKKTLTANGFMIAYIEKRKYNRETDSYQIKYWSVKKGN